MESGMRAEEGLEVSRRTEEALPLLMLVEADSASRRDTVMSSVNEWSYHSNYRSNPSGQFGLFALVGNCFHLDDVMDALVW